MGTGGSSWDGAEDFEMGLLWNSDMPDYVGKLKNRLIGAHFLCAWEASIERIHVEGRAMHNELE